MRQIGNRALRFIVSVMAIALVAVVTSSVEATLQVVERSQDIDSAVSCTPAETSPDQLTRDQDPQNLGGPRVASRDHRQDPERAPESDHAAPKVCPLPAHPQPEPAVPRARP